MNKADIYVDPPMLDATLDEVYGAKEEARKDPAQHSAFIQTLMNYANTGNELLISRIGFTKADIQHLAEFWAKDNDPELTFLVGQLYDAGFVTAGDKSAVKLKWFRKAAELGQPDAQNLLGYFYAQGEKGFKKDIAQALKWYSLAAKQGNKEALTNLGEIYYLGEQVTLDYAKAFSLFEQAKGQGSSQAWRYLAWMYTNGQYVKADCKTAADYFVEGQSRIGRDEHFLPTCEKDKQARENVGSVLPALTLKQVGIFQGGSDKGYACQLHLEADTNKIGEVANLRVGLNVKNSDGAVSKQTVVFAPFGMNTLNLNLHGYETNSFSNSMLQDMHDKAFCDRLTFEITDASATINGKKVDVLKTGILALTQ